MFIFNKSISFFSFYSINFFLTNGLFFLDPRLPIHETIENPPDLYYTILLTGGAPSPVKPCPEAAQKTGSRQKSAVIISVQY